MAISITEALKGKTIRRAVTDGKVLALETSGQRIRITWEDGAPKVAGIDAMIVLPHVDLFGSVNNAR